MTGEQKVRLFQIALVIARIMLFIGVGIGIYLMLWA